MDIDEILKQQAEWVQRAQDVAMRIVKNRTGTTPEEAGLDPAASPKDIQDRINVLESRRAAVLAAFDSAIQAEQQSLTATPSALPKPEKPTIRQIRKRATPK